MLRVNSRGWEYQCRESRMVNTIFCIFLFFYLSIDFFFLYKINWEMDSDLTANRTILHSYCTVIFCDTESLYVLIHYLSMTLYPLLIFTCVISRNYMRLFIPRIMPVYQTVLRVNGSYSLKMFYILSNRLHSH